MPPAISVIVPSALKSAPDGRLWLERAVASVQAQTILPCEIIVGLDPGAGPWPHQEGGLSPIRITHGAVKGHQAACNAAARMATGRLLAFLEDDDVFRENHLEVMAAAMEESGADFVSASQVLADDTGEKGPFDFPTASSWLVSKLVWLQVGGFDARWRTHHDNEWLNRINAAGVRRLHLVEEDADLDRPGPNGQHWLRMLEQFTPIRKVPGLRRLTVERYLHADSVLAQAGSDRAKAQRSADEFAALRVLYGHVGW